MRARRRRPLLAPASRVLLARALTVLGALALALLVPSGSAQAERERGAERAEEAADELRVAAHQFALAAPGTGWRAVAQPRADEGAARADADADADGAALGPDARLLLGFVHEGWDATLAVSRVEVANFRAWRRKAAFFDEVEAGVEAAYPGYRRTQREQQRLGRVPALDLAYRERGGQRRLLRLRFLFFRRYTLALALRMPARTHARHERRLQALVDSFAPFFGER